MKPFVFHSSKGILYNNILLIFVFIYAYNYFSEKIKIIFYFLNGLEDHFGLYLELFNYCSQISGVN